MIKTVRIALTATALFGAPIGSSAAQGPTQDAIVCKGALSAIRATVSFRPTDSAWRPRVVLLRRAVSTRDMHTGANDDLTDIATGKSRRMRNDRSARRAT
jgi:hypothetical protein